MSNDTTGPAPAKPRRRFRLRARTGAGAVWNPDNIVVFWLEVALLSAAVAAAGVGSIDGLLHYAVKVTSPGQQWTLAVAIDVFLVGAALTTLSLRRRGARFAVGFCWVITFILVVFSSFCNYMQKAAQVGDSTDPADLAAPWIKAAMPFLLLAAVEMIAALTSTKNQPAARAARAKAKAKKRTARKPAAAKTAPLVEPTAEVTL